MVDCEVLLADGDKKKTLELLNIKKLPSMKKQKNIIFNNWYDYCVYN